MQDVIVCRVCPPNIRLRKPTRDVARIHPPKKLIGPLVLVFPIGILFGQLLESVAGLSTGTHISDAQIEIGLHTLEDGDRIYFLYATVERKRVEDIVEDIELNRMNPIIANPGSLAQFAVFLYQKNSVPLML